MNGLYLLLFCLVVFSLGYVFYGGFISKLVGINSAKECPSETKRDDIDYTPTSPYILFGHHFSSIAGAGPIVGPVMACIFGWGPAALWIILGCIFIGTIHDFTSMFLSVRNEGRSIAYVIEHELGYIGRQIFLTFCVLALLLVIATFTIMVKQTFMGTPAVATASILFILIAPFFGVLVRQKLLSLAESSAIFVPLLFFCIFLGTKLPLDISLFGGDNVCLVGLLYYAAIASVLPVWFLLQPRDYLNSYLLLVMMVLAIVGIFVVRPEMNMPFFVNPAVTYDNETLNIFPMMIPLLFVTIACGACSGFHSLVSSGTSSKQVDNEAHIKPITMGAMYLEGILAIIAIVSVGYLGYESYYSEYTAGDFKPALVFANGVGTIFEKLGFPRNYAVNFVSLSISAFILTSLDTCMRLARFIVQELALPRQIAKEGSIQMLAVRKFISNRWVATIILVILSSILIFKSNVMDIWPIFGSANQLLASIALLTVTLYFKRTGKKVLFVLLPTIFMFCVSSWSLVCLFIDCIDKNKHLLGTISVLLLMTVFFILSLGVKAFIKNNKPAVEN